MDLLPQLIGFAAGLAEGPVAMPWTRQQHPRSLLVQGVGERKP